jgi:hypothetical protein
MEDARIAAGAGEVAGAGDAIDHERRDVEPKALLELPAPGGALLAAKQAHGAQRKARVAVGDSYAGTQYIEDGSVERRVALSVVPVHESLLLVPELGGL